MNKHIFKVLIGLVIIILVGLMFKLNKNKTIITSDGDGYYIYLPAFVIYKDINFTNKNTFSAAYNKQIIQSYFARESNGKKIDQFTCGLALLWLPFFLIAHLISVISGNSPDGYNLIYQQSIGFAGLVYLLVGLFFIYKFLSTYDLSKFAKYIAIGSIFLGTNLFHYSLMEPSMSHLYSFSIITIFLWAVRRYFVQNTSKYLWISLIFLAVIILIRPFNVLIILLVPFLADNFSQCKNGFRNIFIKHYKQLTLGVLLFVLIISIQCIIWYIQTGNLFIYSYKNQGFNFNEPHFSQVLFSYRKGLFVYAPILLFALPGLFVLFKKNKYQFLFLTFFLITITYTISTWWNWWYGMSYGHRAFIDYYSIFALLIGLFYDRLKNKIPKYIVLTILLFFVFLNQLQSYQYRKYILHWDLMTKEKYWSVFLKTGESGYVNLWNPIKNEKSIVSDTGIYLTSKNDMENIYEKWNNEASFINNLKDLPSGELCVKTDNYYTTTPVYTRNLSDFANMAVTKITIKYQAFFKNRHKTDPSKIDFFVKLDSADHCIRQVQNQPIISPGINEWNKIEGNAQIDIANLTNKNLKTCFVSMDSCERYFDNFICIIFLKK